MAAAKSYGSTVGLVRAVARVSRGEARARVDAAADVLPCHGVTQRHPRDPAVGCASGTATGGYELAGWLDQEAAEILRSALSPLAAPGPATDVEVDLRTGMQRDADAGVELAARALRDVRCPPRTANAPRSWSP
jgi:hypothetical protein